MDDIAVVIDEREPVRPDFLRHHAERGSPLMRYSFDNCCGVRTRISVPLPNPLKRSE